MTRIQKWIMEKEPIFVNNPIQQEKTQIFHFWQVFHVSPGQWNLVAARAI